MLDLKKLVVNNEQAEDKSQGIIEISASVITSYSIHYTKLYDNFV